MSYELDQGVDMNESKFLSEQVNWDQEPTEEEIIQKAEELGIDDYGMAKEALLKELDPEWRPYLNRHGQVFYINLDQKKGYLEHPIDMFYKIHFAMKNNKKVPKFQEFSIEKISQDPRIILKEINNFKVNQTLKIVYEESEEESVRKNTKRSEDGEMDGILQYESFNLQYENQVNRLRDQLKRQMKIQLDDHRKRQQGQYQKSMQRHENRVTTLKQQRLKEIAFILEKQWELKNKSSFERSLQNSKIQFNSKLQRYEDILAKEENMVSELHNMRDVRVNYELLYKQKVINKKQQERDSTMRKLQNKHQKSVHDVLFEAQSRFTNNSREIVDSKMNYQQIFNKNMGQMKSKHRQPLKKKRYSIFYPELLNTNIMSKVEEMKAELKCDEPIWSTNQFQSYSSSGLRLKPSLSLRLFKRIL